MLTCWEEGRVSHVDGFLEAKITTEISNLNLADVTIHIGHKNYLVTSQLPGGDNRTKTLEKCSPSGQELPQLMG